jgi:hypothetical protein
MVGGLQDHRDRVECGEHSLRRVVVDEVARQDVPPGSFPVLVRRGGRD